MSFQDLKYIIDFIYRGEITVPSEHIESVLRSAEILKIKGLADVNNQKGGGLSSSNSSSSHNKVVDDDHHQTSSSRKKKKKKRKDIAQCNNRIIKINR